MITGIDEHVTQVIGAQDGVDRLEHVDNIYNCFVKSWFRRKRGVVNIYAYQYTISKFLSQKHIEDGQSCTVKAPYRYKLITPPAN